MYSVLISDKLDYDFVVSNGRIIFEGTQSNGCHLSLTAKMIINYSLDLKNNFLNVFDCIK